MAVAAAFDDERVFAGGQVDDAEEAAALGGGGADEPAGFVVDVDGGGVCGRAHEMAGGGVRLPGECGDVGFFGEDGFGVGVVGRLRGEGGGEFGEAAGGGGVDGGVGIGEGVEIDAEGRGGEGAADLFEGAFDAVEVDAEAYEGGAVVLVGAGPLVPLIEPGGLLGDVFALVVHGDGDIDDAFFEPGAPVLEHAPVGFAVAPGGGGGGAAAVDDEGGGDGETGPDSEGV